MPAHPKDASSYEQEKDRLLALAVAHVLQHGYQTTSFRTMAEQLGTSHRMLSYYFGSAEAFWEALLIRLRSEQQRRLLGSADQSRRFPTIEEVWSHLTAEASLSVFRIMFQVYGRALAEPEKYQSFLDDVVDSWIDRIAAGLVHHEGMTPQAARVQARLRLAVIRGLMLDLLTTHDLKGTTKALRQFAQLIAPHSAS
jgi:AcrR family transcriptional regulator